MGLLSKLFDQPTMDDYCRRMRAREEDRAIRRAELGVEILPEERPVSSKQLFKPESPVELLVALAIPHYRMVPQNFLFTNPAEQTAFDLFRTASKEAYSLFISKNPLKLTREDYAELHAAVNVASVAVSQLNGTPFYRSLLKKHLVPLTAIRCVARYVVDVTDPFPNSVFEGI